jgi:threonine dehydratase
VRRGNVILGKLEGNNPGGSVKDRPALSMIQRAEERGEIRPGDRLIEATSGNTGIALAMIAAMKGYRMTLLMPDNLSAERRASMTAYGAELILTPAEKGGMEFARDLAAQMQARGDGKVLDQFANADNPRIHYETTGPEIWRDTGGGVTHFVSAMGTTGTIMGVSRFLKGTGSAHSDHRGATRRGFADTGDPQVAGSVPAENLRQAARRPARVRDADRGGSDGTPDGGRGRDLLRRFSGGCPRDCTPCRRRSRARDGRLHRLRSRRSLSVDGSVRNLTAPGLA